jgi:hypothetical protein
MLDDCLAATGTDAGAGWIVLAAILMTVGTTFVLLGRKGGFRAPLVLLVGVAFALSFVPIVAVSTAAAAASDCAPVTTAGTWQGDASVDGLDYSLVATVADDGVVASASVSYTIGGLPLCTSTWSEVSRTGSTITFLETIDPPLNPLNCLDNGTITVTPTGDPLGSTLAWTYVYADPALAASAHGTTLFPLP